MWNKSNRFERKKSISLVSLHQHNTTQHNTCARKNNFFQLLRLLNLPLSLGLKVLWSSENATTILKRSVSKSCTGTNLSTQCLKLLVTIKRQIGQYLPLTLNKCFGDGYQRNLISPISIFSDSCSQLYKQTLDISMYIAKVVISPKHQLGPRLHHPEETLPEVSRGRPASSCPH